MNQHEPSSPGPQLLPHSRENEESLLGSILINPDALLEVLPLLQADDFYIHRHRWVWEAFLRLNEGSRPIDLLTVANELQAHSKLDDVGGMAYLTGLINVVPSSFHAVDYARTVADLGLRRRALTIANDIAKLAYKTDVPFSVTGALESLESLLPDTDEHLHTLPDALNAAIDQIEAAARGELAAIPTGLIDFDKLVQLRPTELHIFAARPGKGKTSLLLQATLQAALHATLSGKRVLIFSIEMAAEELATRLLAQNSGLSTQTMQRGKLDGNQWTLLVQTAEKLAPEPLLIYDKPGITLQEMRAVARRLHRRAPLDLIAVDYLQLVQGGKRFENRQNEVTYVASGLKTLARELKLPVLTAAQLNRASEGRADKRPTLADLRESGSIEQEADSVTLLYPNPDQPQVVELLTEKHRNGPNGSTTLIFDGERVRFLNAETKKI